nr:alpha-1B-glycoprotein-like isoform X2 [Columba livia]
MGTLLLVPLLDPPPPPTITVTPEKLEYIVGDTISLCCSAPPATKEKIQGFHFLGTSGWAVDARVRTKSYVYTFTITGPRDSGAHTCTYSVLTPTRHYLRSRESKPIVISVRDLPPPPTLTLTPAGGVTMEGRPLIFLCHAPAGEAPRRFHFYKDEVEVTEGTQLTSGETEAQLKVAAAGMGLSGNVTCGYEEETEGRWVPSYPSQTRLLLITGQNLPLWRQKSNIFRTNPKSGGQNPRFSGQQSTFSGQNHHLGDKIQKFGDKIQLFGKKILHFEDNIQHLGD